MAMSHAKTLLLLAATAFLGGCTFGPTELLIIFATVLLLFGATRVPQLARALGESVRAFREGTKRDGGGEQIEGQAAEVAQIEDTSSSADDKGDKPG